MSALRFLPVGTGQILVELPDLERTQALFASLQADPVAGVAEIVPAARTLLVRFALSHAIDPDAFAAALRERALDTAPATSDETVEIPVLYDGEDLAEVARLTGLSVAAVVERHLAADYRVAFTGFAPGFAYMSGGDPALAVPRRSSPRTRIPAESVAIAGAFCGIYPRASPGGWQILGRTPVRMFAENRDPAILLRPGMRVRFRQLPNEAAFAHAAARAPRAVPVSGGPAPGTGTVLHIEAAPLPALVQDLGRPGQAADGISISGALDRESLRTANRLVANARGEACLEIVAGITFRVDGAAVIALAGAPCAIRVDAATGHPIPERSGRAIALDPGERVHVGLPERGARAYLAVRGGFAVEPRFASAATDTLAGIGPEPIRPGSALRVRAAEPRGAVGMAEPERLDLPAAQDIVTLDIVLGPRTDWFTAESVERVLRAEWRVTPRSNRIGLRLAGPADALTRLDPAAELASEGTVRGAIQVPHDGQPVLFLADHPLTGGYPVIGVVAAHHLDLAGQIPIGARIRLRAAWPFAEIAPLPKDPDR